MRNLAAKVSADPWPEFKARGTGAISLLRGRSRVNCRYPRRLRQRSAERARLFRRRFRSLHCEPAIAGHASPICTDNKPPRTAVRRGTAKAQDHAQRLRREAGAQAHVRRAHPSRGALARPTLYRVRAPPDRPVRKELNDEYQVSTTPLATSTQPRVSSKSKP